MHFQKFQIERPDPMMLCNRKCTKGTVKHMSRSGYTTLVHQELAVVKPNSWHLGYKETM